MRVAIAVTLVLLALIVAAFVATWVTIPGGRYEERNLTTGRWETARIAYPARLFRVGLVERTEERRCQKSVYAHVGKCPQVVIVKKFVNLHTVRQRARVFYGGLAGVVLLVGLAVAVLLRPSRRPGPAVS